MAAERASVPTRRDKLQVVIAGGGVAALETALALRSLTEERVAIKLIAAEPHFWYRPLSVLEPFGRSLVHPLELADLARACGADFDLGALASVDADARMARTAAGGAYEYDALVIACGARPLEAIPGAFTFRGPADSDAFRSLLEQVKSAGLGRLVFAVPGGVTWPLPLYELALLTAAHLARPRLPRIQLTLVTHEDAPLALFGAEASAAVARMLDERDIAVHTGRYAVSVDEGALTLSPSDRLPADRVISLPRLEGTTILGVPHDRRGFIQTDLSGQVVGLDDVYAAGDVTAFPVKQGGLAAQQADAVAAAIAGKAGASTPPQPFRPVLRGLILTGGEPAYLRKEIAGGAGETSTAETQPLWWPPGKIVGRYLAPFLAEHASVILSPPREVETLPVEIDLTGVASSS